MALLIPEGYKVIAVRDDRQGNCVISYNHDRRDYLLVINGKACGPLTLLDMKQLQANMVDVIEIPKSRYVFITDYDPDGTRRDI